MNKLLPLATAANQIGVTVSALRAEIRRGNLAVTRIGKNYYTTTTDLDAMIETCRVKPSLPASSCDKTETKPNGSSETDSAISELDALKETMRQHSSSSPTISPGNKRPRPGAVVDLHPSK